MTAQRALVGVMVVLALAAVLVLRATTMAVSVPPDRSAVLALELEPHARYGPSDLPRRAKQAATLTKLCALRVDARVLEGQTRNLASGRVRVLVRPAVRGPDRDELTGCIEDLTVRRLIVDVTSVREVPLADVAGQASRTA